MWEKWPNFRICRSRNSVQPYKPLTVSLCNVPSCLQWSQPSLDSLNVVESRPSAALCCRQSHRNSDTNSEYAETSNKTIRNTLDCDQSNYSSRIVFSHIPIVLGQTGIKIRRTRKPHIRTKHEVDRTTPGGDMTIWNFPNMAQMRKSVGRRSVGRSVGRSSIYTSSYTVLIYSSSLR